MPANHQPDGSERGQLGERFAAPGRGVCGYCGDRIKSDGGYRALISDAHVVVACSSDHLEELIGQYR